MALAAILYQHDTGKPIDYTTVDTLWMKTLIDYQAKVAAIRLCPTAASTNRANGQGDATHPWSWNSGANLMFGSYALNGWLYPFKGATQLYFPNDGSKCFANDGAITHASQTPYFMDAVWPDIWPKATDRPTADLFHGGTAADQEMQRCLIARHGSSRTDSSIRRVDIKQRLPGAINLSFADGHAELSGLENLWNYYWHADYVPPSIRPGRRPPGQRCYCPPPLDQPPSPSRPFPEPARVVDQVGIATLASGSITLGRATREATVLRWRTCRPAKARNRAPESSRSQWFATTHWSVVL